MAKHPGFTVVHVAQGELEASVIKSHLECEGIPVLLEYESAGRVFGLTVNGLGEVRVLVPEKLAEKARQVVAPREPEDSSDSGTSGAC